jgi:hypothetical protein
MKKFIFNRLFIYDVQMSELGLSGVKAAQKSGADRIVSGVWKDEGWKRPSCSAFAATGGRRAPAEPQLTDIFFRIVNTPNIPHLFS